MRENLNAQIASIKLNKDKYFKIKIMCNTRLHTCLGL